jgi:hypothetical protein
MIRRDGKTVRLRGSMRHHRVAAAFKAGFGFRRTYNDNLGIADGALPA